MAERQIRLRFRCLTIAKGSNGTKVILAPEQQDTSEEDKRFARGTALGDLQITVDADAAETLEIGRSVFLEFSPRPVAAAHSG